MAGEMTYSDHEMADMHFICDRANESVLQASRLYAQTYPDRRHSDRKLFNKKIHQRLSETGSFRPLDHSRGRPMSVRSPEVEEVVLEAVHENPELSTRIIAQQHGIRCHIIVWQIRHDQLLYLYHLQRDQALLPGDFQARNNVCRYLSNQQARNRFIVRNILFTDEASFTRNSINNFNNFHN